MLDAAMRRSTGESSADARGEPVSSGTGRSTILYMYHEYCSVQLPGLEGPPLFAGLMSPDAQCIYAPVTPGQHLVLFLINERITRRG